MAREGRKHFILEGTARQLSYSKQGFGSKVKLPDNRDRFGHGRKLKDQLETIAAECGDEIEGVTIEVRSSPQFELMVESLDLKRSGIELLSVTTGADQIQRALVFVPISKFRILIGKINSYLDRSKDKLSKDKIEVPRNNNLIVSIDEIRRAGIRAMWSDNEEFFPESGVSIWFEVWLRDLPEAENRFREFARKQRLKTGSLILRFVDRIVIPIHCAIEDLEIALEELGLIAEVRLVRVPASEFLELDSNTQVILIEDLIRRVQAPTKDAPAVCLLDNGVVQAHPLLESALEGVDCLTFKASWGTTDRGSRQHGTQMAGIALYGNLSRALLSGGPVVLETRLESYKLLHAEGDHAPELYGAVTQEAGRAVEGNNARERVYCLTITAPQAQDEGKPSSWSSEIDSMAAGFSPGGNDPKRLFVISAGNRQPASPADANYLLACGDSAVQDPGQAWNALTVGAMTNLTEVSGSLYQGWSAVAPSGGIAPCSTTSINWDPKNWPIKPDLVVEGGNWAQSPNGSQADAIDSLSLVSTSNKYPASPLSATGDTSASAAQLALMGATLKARYANLWPETQRALLIQSARWTEQLRQQFGNGTEKLLRHVGYGVPDLARASDSVGNAAVMVLQDQLFPFKLNDDPAKGIQLNQMCLFELPWPVEALLELRDADVTLRVTLSYFVEPNPARRGYKTGYAYSSCGLRFAVKRPEEKGGEFLARINKLAENPDQGLDTPSDPNWVTKAQNRSKGSVHSDWITESATRMARRENIAVYPVSGWWKERKKLERYLLPQRFSLVVSLESPVTVPDLNVAVAQKIGIPIPISSRK